MKFDMYEYIMVPNSVSTAYFIKPPNQPVCLYVYTSIAARQRLGNNVTSVMNILATIEELWLVSFSMRSVPY
jgi:hypothetical protein